MMQVDAENDKQNKSWQTSFKLRTNLQSQQAQYLIHTVAHEGFMSFGHAPLQAEHLVVHLGLELPLNLEEVPPLAG